jgi:SAM-dependent methyltransferase
VTQHEHEHDHGDGRGQGRGGSSREGEAPDAGEAPRFDAAFWDERYTSAPTLWSGHVNAVIRDETEGLVPGTAMDVGCGEGGDALWLAERGWQVLGIDVSPVAIERAAARAAELGLAERAAFEVRDLLAWTPPPATYDLVTAAFIHLPSGDRRPAYAGLAAAVAVGGTLVLAAHHPSDIGVVPRPPMPDLFFTAEQLAADLVAGAGEWAVEVVEARPRPATHPEGHEVTVHDTVLRARRLA